MKKVNTEVQNKKNRIFLLKNIYSKAIEKKIYNICFLMSHTDIIEKFYN